MRDFTWSKKEKAWARTAFDQAYDRDMQALRQELRFRVRNMQTADDIWAIHDFLTQKRHNIDTKYDYRYSQLIFVFARLLHEGLLSEDELAEFSKEKRQAIQLFCRGVHEQEME
jgi:hypothetical protein